jgi:hypothetical protein
MKINGVEMQYQSDPRYSKLVMTHPAWQKEPDTIGQYGCLLTAKLNAFNLFNKDKLYLTIEQLNDLIIKHKGYKYLFYLEHNQGDLEKTKKDCFGKESFQIPETVNWILGINNEEKKYTGKIDILSKNDYYIIKTKYQDTGHYSLIVKEDKSYLDSYDGIIKPGTTTILDIIKITF